MKFYYKGQLIRTSKTHAYAEVRPAASGDGLNSPMQYLLLMTLYLLVFSHLWHNITMPKLVKSILHSHL